MYAGRGGHNVDDGVDCANFVEVDLVYGNVMDAGFGGTEVLEGPYRRLDDRGGKRGGANEFADDGERAAVCVFVLVRVLVKVIRFFSVGVRDADLMLMLGLGRM